MDIDTLDAKIADITLGDLGFDLYLVLSHFFSQEEVKERMVYLNQSQLYEHTILADGTPTPKYAISTLEKRAKNGMSISPGNYHYHEYGELFRAMGVKIADDGVMMVCEPNNSSVALNEDFMEGSRTVMGIEGDAHIEDFFHLYDANREGLGLTEENLLTLREDMVEYVQKELRDYING